METSDFKSDAHESFDNRKERYTFANKSKTWFERNFFRLKMLFENDSIRSYVFEPVSDALNASNFNTDNQVRAVITQVAVTNAVLAGLPGKLGVGVIVSMGLEAYMAYAIANRIGIRMEQRSDILKYFGVLAGTVGSILWLFRQLLSFAYSLFSVVPMLPPMVLAELFVTDVVGVLFWVGFEEARKHGSFRIPKRMFVTVGRRAKELWRYQRDCVTSSLSPSSIKLMSKRVKGWLTGDIIPTGRDAARLRGDAFAAGALAWLLMGREEELGGPLGQHFIQAIRLRFPKLADASVTEIGDFMREQYDEEQLEGVLSLIKGKMFELMVESEENLDGDEWSADLHDDESFPGSDVVFTNYQTGEEIEVSIKATSSTEYIENALMRYPDIPIVTTAEMEEHFPNYDNIMFSDITNEHVTEVTEDNFEDLLDKSPQIDDSDVAVGTGSTAAISGTVAVWPFAAAYLRGRISREQFKRACKHILPRTGGQMAFRIIMGACLGPIYAWYLLARMTMRLTPEHADDFQKNIVVRKMSIA